MASKANVIVPLVLIILLIMGVVWGIWFYTDDRELRNPKEMDRLHRKGYFLESVRSDGWVVMVKRRPDGKNDTKTVRMSASKPLESYQAPAVAGQANVPTQNVAAAPAAAKPACSPPVSAQPPAASTNTTQSQAHVVKQQKKMAKKEAKAAKKAHLESGSGERKKKKKSGTIRRFFRRLFRRPSVRHRHRHHYRHHRRRDQTHLIRVQEERNVKIKGGNASCKLKCKVHVKPSTHHNRLHKLHHQGHHCRRVTIKQTPKNKCPQTLQHKTKVNHKSGSHSKRQPRKITIKTKCLKRRHMTSTKKLHRCHLLKKPIVRHRVCKCRAAKGRKVYKHTFHDLHGNMHRVHVRSHKKKHHGSTCTLHYVKVIGRKIKYNREYKPVTDKGLVVPGHVFRQNVHHFNGFDHAVDLGVSQQGKNHFHCWGNIPKEVAFDPKYYGAHKRVLIKVPKAKSAHAQVTFCIKV